MAELSAVGRRYVPQGGYNIAGGAGGALSGAATGAAFGSAVPVVGTALGAVVGGVVGLLGGFGGGGPEIPSAMDNLRHWAISQGLVPDGKTAQISVMALLDRGNPTMLAAARELGVNPAKQIPKYRKALDKFYASGPTTTGAPAQAAAAAQQMGTTGPACACDDRPLQILRALVMALNERGIYG